MELYLGLTSFFTRFDMEMHPDVPDTMQWKDHGVAEIVTDIRVRIREDSGDMFGLLQSKDI